MKKALILLAVAAISCSQYRGVTDSPQPIEPNNQTISLENVPFMGDAKMIYYDEGRYEAFTDLKKFKGKFYVAFRDSYSHVWEKDGTAQGHTYVIMSEDGENWTRIADQAEAGMDLRDPKLSITPDNKLMVLMGGSKYGNNKVDTRCQGRLPRVSFSENGIDFTTPQPINLDSPSGNDWLWRVDWFKKYCYGFVKCNRFTLVRSKDGINWKTVKDYPYNEVPGDETTVRFLKDGTMLALIRSHKDSNGNARNGMWGVSKPPYTSWSFRQLPISLGGPELIVIDDRYCLIATRQLVAGDYRVLLLKSDFEGNVTPVCALPSGGGGGNSSYAGMIVEGDELWVSYYSAHETPKPAIYLAKIPLSNFEN